MRKIIQFVANSLVLLFLAIVSVIVLGVLIIVFDSNFNIESFNGLRVLYTVGSSSIFAIAFSIVSRINRDG